MDTTKIRFGEAVAAGSALLLFIIMFLPWYGYSVKGTAGLGISASANRSAWQAYSFIDIILFVTIIAAVGMAVLSMSQRSTALPVSASVAVTILGGLSVLLILFRIVSQPDYCRGGVCASAFASRYLAMRASVAIRSRKLVSASQAAMALSCTAL